MSPGLQFRLLGPLEVRNDAHVVPLGGVRQRSVLALLLLARGEVVSADRLVDQLWGESPPAAAATALQGYVSQLRKVLEPERRAGADPQTIVTRAPGYVLPLESDQLDLERFERFAAEGRRNLIDGDAESAAEGLRAALDLWRGPALADLEGERFARDHLLRLEELRLGTLEDRIAADLALGRHHELVPELEDLVRRHP
ncbi:MAG: hypothetical protein QOD53_716, partial [Thermoleophilaceae bacterium]|nr:hypothetical protein [Thermoleophilaceae bacterium]